MGTSLSCKDQNAFKLRPTQRRVCWKDTQKSLRNQGQRSITGSLESGKWSFFFFPSKRLHEGFHVSLSALPLSFNFLLCMPCSPPPPRNLDNLCWPHPISLTKLPTKEFTVHCLHSKNLIDFPWSGVYCWSNHWLAISEESQATFRASTAGMPHRMFTVITRRSTWVVPG